MTSNCSFPLGNLLDGSPNTGGKWYLKSAPSEYSSAGSDCTKDGVAPTGNANGANKMKHNNTCATACNQNHTIIPNGGANNSSNEIPYSGSPGGELLASICPDGLPPGEYVLEYVVELNSCVSTTETSFTVLEQPHSGCDYEFDVCENDTTDWNLWNLLKGTGDHTDELCFGVAITACGFSCDVTEHDTMGAAQWYEDCNFGADQWTNLDPGFHNDGYSSSCLPGDKTAESTFNVNESGAPVGSILKFCYQTSTTNTDPPPDACGTGCCKDCACITINVIAAPQTGDAAPKTVCN